VAQLLDNYKHAIAKIETPAKETVGSAALKVERAQIIPVSVTK
jgi:hypothetical protein